MKKRSKNIPISLFLIKIKKIKIFFKNFKKFFYFNKKQEFKYLCDKAPLLNLKKCSIKSEKSQLLQGFANIFDLTFAKN